MAITINAQGSKPKCLDITQYLLNIDTDLCIVMETWLQDTTSAEAWMKTANLKHIYTMWNAKITLVVA